MNGHTPTTPHEQMMNQARAELAALKSELYLLPPVLEDPHDIDKAIELHEQIASLQELVNTYGYGYPPLSVTEDGPEVYKCQP